MLVVHAILSAYFAKKRIVRKKMKFKIVMNVKSNFANVIWFNVVKNSLFVMTAESFAWRAINGLYAIIVLLNVKNVEGIIAAKIVSKIVKNVMNLFVASAPMIL